MLEVLTDLCLFIQFSLFYSIHFISKKTAARYKVYMIKIGAATPPIGMVPLLRFSTDFGAVILYETITVAVFILNV